ncbi:MAG: hypothetical protein A2017_19195 [Lentisphaerae bacterium GWF2_44_16]|nr:MAG: hypothetical protein A2017_19195 [Lentisphaerae bacterium GWF2_44_16]
MVKFIHRTYELVIENNRLIFNIYSISLLLVMFIFVTPNLLVVMPDIGLDPSWRIGLHLAIKNKFVFGRDIIFTYGPLGFLSSRLPIGVSKLTYFLWDIYILANFVFIFSYIHKTVKSYSGIFLCLLAVICLSWFYIYTLALVNLLFFFFLFMLFCHLRHASVYLLFNAALLSIFTFYIKVNMGLGIILLMLVFLTYIYFRPMKYSAKFVLFFMLGYLLVLPISAWMFNTELYSYIAGSLQLADAYNDAMFTKVADLPELKLSIWNFYMALALVLSLAGIFFIRMKYFLTDRKILLQYLFTIFFIFLVFKHSFVRADGHMLFFFQIFPVTIGMLALFSPEKLKRYFFSVFLISLIFALTIAKDLFSVRQLIAKYKQFEYYIATALETDFENLKNENIERRVLARKFLDRIGNGSVDIIPWEISYVYANKLKYNPRPVIQSYSAYNGWLDEKNAGKYMSDNAPDFVLFSVDDIDDRHPFFSEAMTKLVLLRRYVIAERTDGMLLLRKNGRKMNMNIAPAVLKTVNTGEFIELPHTDKLLLMKVNIKYSIAGYFVRFFFQPPLLEVSLELEDGSAKKYKAVKPIINAGVIVNKFIFSIDDAEKLFRGKAEGNVKRLKFDSPDRWGFARKYIVEISEINIEKP